MGFGSSSELPKHQLLLRTTGFPEALSSAFLKVSCPPSVSPLEASASGLDLPLSNRQRLQVLTTS
jgi:hypothetical protein